MKQRILKAIVIVTLVLQLVILSTGIGLFFTPLRTSVVRVFFSYTWIIPSYLKNAFLYFLVKLLQLLIRWWPLLFAITKKTNLKSFYGFKHVWFIRSIAVLSLLLSVFFWTIISQDYELQRIEYYKALFPGAFD